MSDDGYGREGRGAKRRADEDERGGIKRGRVREEVDEGNLPTHFVTNSGEGGSSLYLVSAHWVIRCSGNSTGGRTPTTFIRKRSIRYIDRDERSHRSPALGDFPREGGHDGNTITVILDRIDRDRRPPGWVHTRLGEGGEEVSVGVSWETAVDEIDAACECARERGWERASREVGREFARDL